MKPTADTRFYHFFGINDSPFSIAPDPHYLFLGEKHQEALAHLFYGIGNEGGFIVLTGEVGTGKTTVCRTILQQMPDATDVAYIVNPRLDGTELLQSICDELGLFYDAEERTNKVMLDILTKFLLASHSRGRHTLLIIDEAQNLSADVLEQIRLLTNLETNEKKLLQLVLIGQPELADMLASKELRQLSQRVTARYHLETLTRAETGSYITHRLRVAGFQGPLFSAAALRSVYRASGGVPRLINVLCERCMLGAYVSESRCIDAAIVKRASRELKDPERKSRRMRRKLDGFHVSKLTSPALALLMLGVGIYYGSSLQHPLPSQSVEDIALTTQPAAEQNTPIPEALVPVVTAVAKGAKGAKGAKKANENVASEVFSENISEQRELALRELAARWKIDVPEDQLICQAVASDGLSCLELELAVEQLRQLGLPGVIERERHGETQFLALETSADLQQLVQQQSSPIRFWLLWRSPPMAARDWPYSLGDDHEGIVWLQRRLNWYQGRRHHWVSAAADDGQTAIRDRFDWLSARSPVLAVTARQRLFSDDIRNGLKHLQQQLGWQPTGQGDLLTLVKLDTMTNTRAPSLVHSG
jgi:general secretion pathway protein A